MSNARGLKLFEIIQHCLAERAFVITELGVFVFQVNCFRFVELVIEQITVGQLGFDDYCFIR